MPNDKRKFKTPPKVAEYFGVNTAKIHGAIQRGELPAINIAEPGCTRPRYLIHEDDIAAFEKSRRVIPGGETTTQKLRRKSQSGVKEFF